ncbi:MAG: hypothetical protein IT557_18520 [Alphaproteobacteria bacterium]|nr:hypothetical protein [Alphaproteobacteria bacterium]
MTVRTTMSSIKRALLGGAAVAALALGFALSPMAGIGLSGGVAYAQGQGQRGPSDDSDSVGPRYGGGENSRRPPEGSRGGRPVWAQEGIPEVELGRLSVARSPSHVIDHAFTEVLSNWTTLGSTVLTLTATGQPMLTMTVAQLCSLPAEQFANIVRTYYESIQRIDSPLENLALLRDIRVDNATQLTGVTPATQLDLAAIFLGSASDKNLTISSGTVVAINTILGLPTLTTQQIADFAAQAEAVRLAILAGHG